MNRIVIALASIATVLFSVAISAGQQPAADEAALRSIVGRVQEGWNAGDGKAFAAPFAENADYVIVNGMRIKGRDVIASGHQQIFDTIYKKSINKATIRSIRFLRDDIAVVHVEWHLKFYQGDLMREGRAMNSMVMAKENGKWSIAAFHNTPIAAGQK